MSETPQTPPPSENPTPAGQGRQAVNFNADQMKAAVQGANQYDLGIIGAGVLAFIFSLFSYYKYSVHFLGASASGSVSAWHGFFGWFAALVALAASIVLALAVFGRMRFPFPVRLTVLAGYAVAALCVILALFVIPGGDVEGTGIDKGHGIGYWLSLIVILGGTALAFMRKDTAEA